MGKKRDFTESTIKLMYDNVDTNPGTVWDVFDNFFAWGKAFFTFDEQLKDDFSNLNSYLHYIEEMENITSQKLDEILQNVENTERDYSVRFKASTDEMIRLGNDLSSFMDRMEELKPITPEDVPGLEKPSLKELIGLTTALIAIYGPDATIALYLDTPEKIAQARIDAEEKGVTLPLTKEQLDISEEIYQEMKAGTYVPKLETKPTAGVPGPINPNSNISPQEAQAIAASKDPLQGLAELNHNQGGYPHYNPSGSHNGADLYAPEGTAIISTFWGEVVQVVNDYDPSFRIGLDDPARYKTEGWGNYVMIKVTGAGPDGGDIYVIYAHMQQAASLAPGDPIEPGFQLGAVGSTGASTAYHIHFEVRNSNKQAVNPYDYLNPKYIPQYLQ